MHRHGCILRTHRLPFIAQQPQVGFREHPGRLRRDRQISGQQKPWHAAGFLQYSPGIRRRHVPCMAGNKARPHEAVQRQLLHAASRYSADLCTAILNKRAALPGVACRVEEALAESISHLNNDLLEQYTELKTVLNTIPGGLTGEALVHYYHDEVFFRMQKVRTIIDHLETLVAADYWPVPTYYDLLFSV